MFHYKARWKRTLERHVVSLHTDIKFKCNFCDFETSSKDSLTRHTQAKHEGRTFSCIFCDFKSTLKKGVRKHMKRIHKLSAEQQKIITKDIEDGIKRE